MMSGRALVAFVGTFCPGQLDVLGRQARLHECHGCLRPLRDGEHVSRERELPPSGTLHDEQLEVFVHVVRHEDGRFPLEERFALLSISLLDALAIFGHSPVHHVGEIV